MLGAIWKSAALGCSPPSTPAAIQSSTLSSIAGSAVEATPDVLVAGLVEAGRERHDRRRGRHRQADRDARAWPPPSSCAAGPCRCLIVHQRIWRIGCCRSLVAEALGLLDRGPLLGVGGEQRRLGHASGRARGRSGASPAPVRRRSSAPARSRRGSRGPAARPWRPPAAGRCACRGCPCARASAARRCWGARRGSRRAGRPRHDPMHRRPRPATPPRPVAIIAQCSSRSTSATPRPTSAPSTASGWSSTGASRPRAGATGDELAERIGGLLGALRDRARQPRRRLRLLGRAAARQPVRAADRALPGGRVPAVGPGMKTGMPIRIDNPLEVGADRLVNAVAAYERVRRRLRRRRLRHRDQLRRRLRGRRVPRRGDRPRPGDLPQRPGRTRRADRPDRPRRARGGDRPLQPRRDPVGLRLRLRRPDRRRRRAGSRRSCGEARFLATGGLAAAIVPFTETIEEVDDLLTLKGLRLIHERNE